MATKQQIAESLVNFEALLELIKSSNATNENTGELAKNVHKKHHIMFLSKINFSTSNIVFWKTPVGDEEEFFDTQDAEDSEKAKKAEKNENGGKKSEHEDDGTSWSTVTTKKKKRVCRSTYKGVECDMVVCDFDHPTICTACMAGKERRDPKCKLWHVAPAKPKSKSTATKSTTSKSTASKSTALGKGSRGKVPFSSSNPKGNQNKDYSGLKRKLAVSETQCLRAELALIKAQRSNLAPSRRKYSSVVSPLTRLPAPTQAVSTPASSTPDVVQILAQMAQQSQQMSQQFAALAARLQA
jgi:hypothetical protein